MQGAGAARDELLSVPEAEHVNSAKLTFPPVEDGASVAVATDQVIQALRDDTIEFRRAGLLLSGLRLARINLKQLALEMGEETHTPARPARVGHPSKEERLDAELSKMPSLAETLLRDFDVLTDGPTGLPAVDVDAEKARRTDLGQLLLDRLDQAFEIKEEDLGSGPEAGSEDSV